MVLRPEPHQSSGGILITVAYICPSFLPQYRPAIRKFAESYIANSPNGHRFILVLKGDSQIPDEFKGVDMVVESHPNENMDCGSYQMLARKYNDSEAICCLGTHSVIMDKRWLSKLSVALFEYNAALVGASGSYEAGVSCRTHNPHIRSTGFMIRPSDFIALYPEEIKSRRDCIEFESGANSLTTRILSKKGECMVVGRNGLIYKLDAWDRTGGFRQGKQNNLLIWDNQAENFSLMSDKDKEVFTERTFWRD